MIWGKQWSLDWKHADKKWKEKEDWIKVIELGLGFMEIISKPRGLPFYSHYKNKHKATI